MAGIADIRELRPREITTLKAAVYALWTGYGEGNYLATPGEVPSARRLIDLALLRKHEQQMTPQMGLVVDCTNKGFQLFRQRHNGQDTSDSKTAPEEPES